MILIVGPGAVGTILATHLAAAGQKLTLLIRDKDAARYQRAPQLQVDRVDGRPPLIAPKPPLTTKLALDGVDYLFLCVKFPDLEPLLDALPPLPPGLTLVSTLNGVAAIRRIRERFPNQNAVCMSVMFNGQMLEPLHAQITTKAQVLIGSEDARLLGAFAGSGMEVVAARGESAAWGKLLINLANAVCALTHTTFRDLLSQRDLRAVYTAVLDEAVAALDAAGLAYHLPMPIPYGLYRRILRYGGPLPWWFARARNGLQDGAYPSMVADIETGRRTEIAQLNGEIVMLGEKIGRPTPVNAKIVSLIRAIEGRGRPEALAPQALRAKLGI